MDRNSLKRISSMKATLIILAVNVVYFIVLWASGALDSSRKMVDMGALYIPYVIERHEYYRLMTAAFMHFSVRHIFGNMLLLAVLGHMLEAEFGTLIYTVCYMAAAAAANAVSVLWYWRFDPYTISAGASGAVFGLVGIVLWLVIVNRGRYRGINLFRVLLMVVFSLYIGITGGGTNNVAHVAGLVCGLICGIIFYRRGRGGSGNFSGGGDGRGAGMSGYNGYNDNYNGFGDPDGRIR